MVRAWWVVLLVFVLFFLIGQSSVDENGWHVVWPGRNVLHVVLDRDFPQVEPSTWVIGLPRQNSPLIAERIDGLTAREYVAKVANQRTYYRWGATVEAMVDGPGPWVVLVTYVYADLAREWGCLGAAWYDRVFALRVLAASPHMAVAKPSGLPSTCER